MENGWTERIEELEAENKRLCKRIAELEAEMREIGVRE